MRKKLALLGLGAAALFGCRNDTTSPIKDLAGVVQDLSMTPSDGPVGCTDNCDGPVMMGATIHDIDVGNIQGNTMVTITGVVLTGIANGQGHSKSSMKCEYDAYVQDPNGTAPDGIRLFATGGTCTPVDGGSCKCPYPPKSGTILDQLSPPNNDLGSILTITGTASTYNPMIPDAGLGPTQHEIDLNKGGAIMVTGTGGTVAPYVDANGSDFAVNGPGYVMYESMLVTIMPASPAQTSALDKFRGFTYAGAYFSGDYNFVYAAGNMGMYPPAGATFKSITGIAEPSFGGGVAPRVMGDFQQ